MQEIVKSQSFKSKTVFAQPHWVTANLGSYTQDGLRAISSQTEKLIGRKDAPRMQYHRRFTGNELLR